MKYMYLRIRLCTYKYVGYLLPYYQTSLGSFDHPIGMYVSIYVGNRIIFIIL